MSFSVQWFPGHMAKTKRALRRYIDFAQIILYTIDARAPLATFSKDAAAYKKKLALVFAKSDLADPPKTEAWRRWFRGQGFHVLESGLRAVAEELNSFVKAGTVHAVVAGLPNVGKSTLINRLIGKKKTRTGARPGVTRGPQWVKLRERFLLLDTPGVFFPENLSPEKTWRLAAVGTVPDKAYSSRTLEICERLVAYARNHYAVFNDSPREFLDFLQETGKKRGVLRKGGEINLEDTARRLIADFQKGNWGRITLEEPAGTGLFNNRNFQ